ncbi:hypothetical protein GN244_ATG06180 [Phytophthora infestans]|uniref:Uncharacterized protein n=1 Tax=Phytophthora infestans TaxID=4787 RepID=A0A833T132_PHYIN|nr:hypothetical protein GN244_ATG06180 [Phytophthora infestans]
MCVSPPGTTFGGEAGSSVDDNNTTTATSPSTRQSLDGAFVDVVGSTILDTNYPSQTETPAAAFYGAYDITTIPTKTKAEDVKYADPKPDGDNDKGTAWGVDELTEDPD